MKLLAHLISFVCRVHSEAGHDDNLRAGKETASRRLQPGHWNSLLL